MRKNIFFWGLSIALILVACTKSIVETPSEMGKKSAETTSIATATAESTTAAYSVVLESKINNGNGTYTWTWSVQNPNPGTGLNGTVQDLSHWGITLGTCATMADVVSGAYSADGISWTSFVPVLQEDKSQSCSTTPFLKFDFGTSGTAKSYFRLTITKNLETDNSVTALYKSGRNTGCGLFTFPGFGCPPVVVNSCSMSQGYYFAKPNLVWETTVKVGGKIYTQEEGKAIWKASNRGGIPDSKAGFTQVVAIKLSSATVHPSASVWADVAIVEAYLSTLNKLSPTYLPTGNTAAKAAAGRIGDWIDANHCQ